MDKFGIRIPSTGRYVSWADNWYETSTAITMYTKDEVDSVFEKLKDNCFVYNVELTDSEGNIVDTKSVFKKSVFGSGIKPVAKALSDSPESDNPITKKGTLKFRKYKAAGHKTNL